MLNPAGEVSRPGPADEQPEPATNDASLDTALLGVLAQEVLRDRRRRARHLPSRLLGEPAWDILLDLYGAACRGQTVSVSQACLAADAPASTALRWLHHLAAEGLVERWPDPNDARRHYIRLTGRGVEQMTAYFSECRGELVGEIRAGRV
jgi:DNA-binding MarR family transcriptional regulator